MPNENKLKSEMLITLTFTSLFVIFVVTQRVFPALTLIRESWKKSRSRSPEKIPSAALHHLYIFLCFGIISRQSRSVTVPKMAYFFCSARHICPHNGICYFPESALGDGLKNSWIRVIGYGQVS